MRVLLTGGSGFIAAHTLDLLLEHGHSVVTTVRSQDKANKIKEAHPKASKDQLDFAIVEDIAQENAFDEAVKSNPPFEAVVHTASPFHFNAKDIQKELLDPAVIGTTGILKSIKKSAPTVKRVVITSSFASIINPKLGAAKGKVYSEADWNPVTAEEALETPQSGYRASKTFAEKAAWDFLEKEKPNFSIATICPPVVFGPIVHYLNSLDALNTSNTRVRDMVQGKMKDGIAPSGTNIWVEVRDVAKAHVNAMERSEAANRRYLTTAGLFTNKEVVEIIRKNFPEYRDVLPPADAKDPDIPAAERYTYDHSRATKELGIQWIPLEKSIVDLVKSLKAVGV